MSPPEAGQERDASQGRLFLTSPLLLQLGVRHGFFMRVGGMSLAPFDSLNFSTSVGDDPASVSANRELGALALGVSPERVYRVSQVHGCEVIVVRGPEANTETASRQGDAVVSGASGAACGIITADCVPVLVASRDSAHVAAIHSGWRGFVAGVVPRAIEALQSLGARDLVAAVGPHISLEAFEVSPEVAAQLAALAPGREVVRSDGPRPHADLRLLARAQLEAAGLGLGAIDDVAGCTYLEPEHFFSYRRDGARSGRQLAAIVSRD